MEQLPAAERARISKMSTEYLISKLAKETDRPVSEFVVNTEEQRNWVF